MIRSDKWRDVDAPRFPSQCFGLGLPEIALAGLAMSAIGTGVSVIGQANSAQAQASAQAGQANYMAQVARNNQMLAERNAALVTQQGEIDAQKKQLEVGQVEGKQRAALASQGGDVNSGSPLDILGDTARAGYTDVATIRSNAAYAAYGYKVQGAGFGGQAGLYGSAATNATNSLSTLPFGVGSSLLGGASSIADKWVSYKKNFPSGFSTGDSIGAAAP